jgi:hypothetical protein
MDGAKRSRKRGECSIAAVRGPLRWIAGGAAFAGALSYGLLRRRRAVPPAPAAEDARAAELRRKLDESRMLADERDEFEAAETPVDEAEATGGDLEERRRRVHERGRAAADRMRESDS